MRPLSVVFVSLALILTFLSITTNYWFENVQDQYNSGLFFKCSLRNNSSLEKFCQKISYIHSRGLAISGLICLLITLLILIFSWFKLRNLFINYIIILFLLITSILLILTFIFYPKEKTNLTLSHSSYLICIAIILTFLSTILTIFDALCIS
ncbi:unnamed protein product [Adineta steineri]|uniref:Uncharacterized protein n=1 Tax=Adineta steineri TaxID=433720 RepID=A0A814HQZ6_9BILA|nr:unnamed protein product [Adineta steineri]CAF1012743.1 unnamed protein product [Adineta steineri]CAF1051370.1 unnamed protein product [Adineta steineri]